ncbi:MAG: argininosuccinate synthetase [Chaenotheca gracillima]|nr:MAG: argininosuccinate synthetase [Chaenotheca gracillima]
MKKTMRSDNNKRRVPPKAQTSHSGWMGSTPKRNAQSTNPLAKVAAGRSFGVPDVTSASQLPTYASRTAPMPSTLRKPKSSRSQQPQRLPPAPTKKRIGGLSTFWSSQRESPRENAALNQMTRQRIPKGSPPRSKYVPPAPVKHAPALRNASPPKSSMKQPSSGLFGGLKSMFGGSKKNSQAKKIDKAEQRHQAKKAAISKPLQPSRAPAGVSKLSPAAAAAMRLRPDPKKDGLLKTVGKRIMSPQGGTMVVDFMLDESPMIGSSQALLTPLQQPSKARKMSSELSFACRGWTPPPPPRPRRVAGRGDSPSQKTAQWCKICGKNPARAPSTDCRICATERLARPPNKKPIPPRKSGPPARPNKKGAQNRPLDRPIVDNASRKAAYKVNMENQAALCPQPIHTNPERREVVRRVASPCRSTKGKIEFAGDRDTSFYKFYDNFF